MNYPRACRPAVSTLALLLLAGAQLAQHVQAADVRYGIQFDAGSSGTRVYVYAWDMHTATDLPPKIAQVSTEDDWSKKQTPGLSSFVGSPSDAGASLSSLVDFAKQELASLGIKNPEQLAQVPVFLGATAGMRIIDQRVAQQIMQSVRTFLQNAGFMYRDEWVRIISGEEEGVFGWVATNALTGTLLQPGESTIGALDLGGASTQITFHPDEAILSDFFPLILGNVSHNLFSHSFLYFGEDQARRQFQKRLAGSTTATNPCYATGFNSTSMDGSRTLIGSSDWASCLATATQVIEAQQLQDCFEAHHDRCVWTGAYLPAFPSESDQFFAFSAFFYTYTFMQVPTGRGTTGDLAVLKAKASSVCSLDFEHLSAYNSKLPKPQPTAYMVEYCFNAAYEYALLKSGYGMAESKTPVSVVDTIDGADVAWSYGSMLWEVNNQYLAYQRANSARLVSPFFLYGFCVTAALVLMLTVAGVFFYFKRNRGEPIPADGGSPWQPI